MLCSFAHLACSALLHRFVYVEQLCKVALTCRFEMDVLFLWQVSLSFFDV